MSIKSAARTLPLAQRRVGGHSERRAAAGGHAPFRPLHPGTTGLACQDDSRRLSPRTTAPRSASTHGRRATPRFLEFLTSSSTQRPPPASLARMLSAFAAFDPSDMRQRFAAADRRIRNRGLSYRVAGEKDERDWPIGRMPLLITEAEWRQIAEGVSQRAELLERVLADVYGVGGLIASGALPAAAITGSMDYVPGMRSVKPPGGRWLRLYAVDIGRGPDGAWWVLGDRTQAPSGCGYALENRLVVSQAFSDLYSQLNVQRLAPFFRSLGAGLRSAGQRSDPRIAILSPGPLSLTYSEQAYLARYLGFLLVEGDDLVMREGRIFVRTIAGLKRCDVIWRHIDADWCDPLELNASSRIGVPGMIEAIRQGGVAVENMPGTGFIESRAMLAFLPALARELLGQDLLMPNTATWWCGQPKERERVLDEFDSGIDRAGVRRRPPCNEGALKRYRRGIVSPREGAAARCDRCARHGLCRTGGGAPVDDAAMGRGWPRAPALRIARLLRGDAKRLACDARRLLSHFRPCRRARRFDGRRRRVRRRLGARRQPGRGLEPASEPGQRADHAAARQSAEPGRRQPVLVRTLPGAGGSDTAGCAMPCGALGRSGRSRARRPSGARPADGRPGRLGRGGRDGPEGGRRRSQRPGPARFEPLRLGAVAGALGAHVRVGHP